MTLWAHAKMRHPPPAVVQARLDEEVVRKLSGFDPQGYVSNTLWAMAKMGRLPTPRSCKLASMRGSGGDSALHGTE